MAVPADTFQTYQAIGIREDLIDIITNIAPMDTWVTSNTGSTRSTNTLHYWQTDTLAAAAANAVIEGDDAASTAVVPTVKVGNYTQILRKVFSITDTQDAVNTAGREKESAYQMQKTLKELARDLEYALVISSATAAGASATARQMKGIEGWIATNVDTGTSTAATVMDESRLTNALSLMWAQGGRPSTLLVGAWSKRKIDAFTTNTRQIGADESKLVAAIDIFKSSFGPIAIRLHQQINTTIPSKAIILGDMSLWNKAWLRPIKKEQLARTGSSTKFMIEAELTLESRQEKGSAKLTNLTTA